MAPIGNSPLFVYSLPSDVMNRKDGEIVDQFFQMIHSPETHARRIEYAYHDILHIGYNVDVYVPSAITQKLKITVIEMIDGKEKKSPPYIELPRDECMEKDNALEYQNVRMEAVIEIKGRTFLFPIQGNQGQKGTNKQELRAVHHYPDSRMIFFSKAKLPFAPIKKKLKKLGVTHMSFVFLVNGKVVRDSCTREAIITTENSLGTEQRHNVNKKAYQAFINNDNSNNDNDSNDNDSYDNPDTNEQTERSSPSTLPSPNDSSDPFPHNYNNDNYNENFKNNNFNKTVNNNDYQFIQYDNFINFSNSYETNNHSYSELLNGSSEAIFHYPYHSDIKPPTLTMMPIPMTNSSKRKRDCIMEQIQQLNEGERDIVEERDAKKLTCMLNDEQLSVVSDILAPLVKQKKKRDDWFL